MKWSIDDLSLEVMEISINYPNPPSLSANHLSVFHIGTSISLTEADGLLYTGNRLELG